MTFDGCKDHLFDESCTFWTTFLVLKNVKSLIISYIKNRFGKL